MGYNIIVILPQKKYFNPKLTGLTKKKFLSMKISLTILNEGKICIIKFYTQFPFFVFFKFFSYKLILLETIYSIKFIFIHFLLNYQVEQNTSRNRHFFET